MSDTTKTTYVIPDQNSTSDNMAAMAMMNGGGFGNNMWNNPFMYLIWLAMFNNGGWFGNNNNANGQDISRQIQTVQNALQDNHNSDLIMQGINGNTEAVRQAADRIGLNYNALNSAVQNVANSISQVGSQVGFSSERVINAINAGDAGLSQALCQAACGIRSDITNQGYQNQLANCQQTNALQNSIYQVQNAMTNGFTNLGYQNQQQSCSLETTIRDSGTANTAAIINKLDQMSTQALQDKIDTLQAKVNEQAVTINNGIQSAMFNQMLTQAVTPINTAITTLNTELYDVKCKLPNTVTLPYSGATAVPTSIASYYGSYNNGYWN